MPRQKQNVIKAKCDGSKFGEIRVVFRVVCPPLLVFGSPQSFLITAVKGLAAFLFFLSRQWICVTIALLLSSLNNPSAILTCPILWADAIAKRNSLFLLIIFLLFPSVSSSLSFLLRSSQSFTIFLSNALSRKETFSCIQAQTSPAKQL